MCLSCPRKEMWLIHAMKFLPRASLAVSCSEFFFNHAYLRRHDSILQILRNSNEIFQPSLWLDKDMSYQPITGSRLQCCHQVVELYIKVVFFFFKYRHDCILVLRDFLRLRHGYIYKYVLPGIVENLERTVIKRHATQRNRRHTVWLSLAESHLPGIVQKAPPISRGHTAVEADYFWQTCQG